jgi:integrase
VARRPARATPRRALRWAAVDLDRGLLFVERQRTTASYTFVEGDPKTASHRAVALDKHTIVILREHRRRQSARRDRRQATHMAWIDTGYLFTRKDGQPINPNYATTRFRNSPNAPTYPRSGC